MFWEWMKNRLHNKGHKATEVKRYVGTSYDTLVSHCRKPITMTVGELIALSTLIEEDPRDVLARIIKE